MPTFLHSRSFWIPSVLVLACAVLLYGWQLHLISFGFLPMFDRPPVTKGTLILAALLSLFLAFDTGLLVWRSRHGSCPLGTKSATGIAGAIAAVALLCPICVAFPASLVGVGFALTVLTPFLPLIQVIALLLLMVSAWMLIPKQ